MSRYERKSVYLCRAPFCKHKNIVWEVVDGDEYVVETAPAWKHRCALCGRGSLDLTYQKTFKPPEAKPFSPSAARDDAGTGSFHPNFKE